MPAESGLQFVDTNILVYAHDVSAREKHAQAKSLLQSLWESGGGCLSVQVLHEFYVTVTQKVPRPLEPKAASDIIRTLSTWKIHGPAATDVLRAIDLQQHYRISFWDAMILHSAARLGSQILWSEDLNPGQVYDGVQVSNPFVAQE